MARTIVLPCSLGDITIGWTAADDEKMLAVLQGLLDRKLRFHILKKGKTSVVTKITQAADARKVVIPDDTFQQLWAGGVIGVGAGSRAETEGGIARTPEQIIENDTIAIQPVAGG